MKNIDLTGEKSSILARNVLESEDTISFQTEIPRQIQQAMKGFIEKHPHWDQYRLVQAAIAGFLFQQGCKDPSVVRHYLGGLFHRESCKL